MDLCYLTVLQYTQTTTYLYVSLRVVRVKWPVLRHPAISSDRTTVPVCVNIDTTHNRQGQTYVAPEAVKFDARNGKINCAWFTVTAAYEQRGEVVYLDKITKPHWSGLVIGLSQLTTFGSFFSVSRSAF